ncbi:hypothetical protein ACHAXT_006468 [Thalassiosira profunda]
MTSRGHSAQCGRPNAFIFSERLSDPTFPRERKLAHEYYKEENPPDRVGSYVPYRYIFERLPKEEQAKYKQLGEEDMVRHLSEMAAYKPSSGWIDGRTGKYKTIIDWDTGYLPTKAEGDESVPKKPRVTYDHARSPWSDINAESVSLIASFLDHPRDAFSMCYTCSGWMDALSGRDSAAQEAVWRPLAMSRFPHLFRSSRDGTADDESTYHAFVLKGSRFTYRDVFIVHDRVIGMDHDATLAPPDESNQIHREGLEEKDSMLTYVLTHYSTRSRRATQYTFGMGLLETAVVPNFHYMVEDLLVHYDSDMMPPETTPRDESIIPVLRCFLTGPGYKTVQIAKFLEFDTEQSGEYHYYRVYSCDDRNEVLPNMCTISGGAMSAYRQDELELEFEADEGEDFIDIFIRLFRGQEKLNDSAAEGDLGASA